jgi:glycosyltransferase involved in cell wall biosynthesis
MQRPTAVSVVVPSYNYARFLRERIDGILAQTRQDFELIVLDDASTDGSQDILRAYADPPRVRVFLLERNSGNPFVQWNRGVELANAPYVWITEADDAAEPRFLERLVAVLEQHPKVGLVHCGFRRVDEEGRELADSAAWWRDIEPGRWDHDFVAPGRDELRRLSHQNVIGNASGVVFRRALYNAIGGADTGYRLSADWDLWIRMLSRSDVGFVADPLNRWRWHAHSVRQRSLADRVEEREAVRVMATLGAVTGVDPRYLVVAYHCRRAEGWLRGAAPWRAAREAWAALAESPGSGRAWRALARAALMPVRRPLGRAWRRLRGEHP